MEHENAKLHELDKVEWFDVCKHFKPGLTWEEYEIMWDDFQSEKALWQKQKELN